jgi:hypothetical protein
MAFTIVEWHDDAGENCNEDAAQHEERADSVNGGQCSIAKQDNGTTSPGNDLVHDEDLPSLNLHFWMEHLVAVQYSVTDDGRIGGSSEDPGEKIPPTSKPATDATGSFASGYGGPVIDCDDC